MKKRLIVELITEDAISGTVKGAGVQNKAWSSYFLYPRKLVYNTADDSIATSEITHVAIANYQGHENLEYSIPAQKYGVLPIKRDN